MWRNKRKPDRDDPVEAAAAKPPGDAPEAVNDDGDGEGAIEDSSEEPALALYPRDLRRDHAGGDPDLVRVLGVAAGQIGEIVSVARRAEQRVRLESAAAESSHGADRHWSRRDLLAVEATGSVLERLAQLRSEAEALSATLRRASAALSGGAPRSGGPGGRPLSAGGEGRADREPAGARKISPRPGPGPEGLRLLAAQMAAAGRSRLEIEDRLRRDFDVVDAGAVVERALGRSQ